MNRNALDFDLPFEKGKLKYTIQTLSNRYAASIPHKYTKLQVFCAK